MKRASTVVGLVVFIVLLPFGLAATVGGPFVPKIDPGDLGPSLQGTYIGADVVARALGLLCWILWFYLILVVLLRLIAVVLVRRNAPSGQTLMSFTGRVTPRFIKRIVDLTIGAALAASSVSLAYATSPPLVPVSHFVQVAHSEGAVAPALGHPSSYVVKVGDTLWDIAEDELGSGYRWRDVYELNRGRKFAGGQVLHNPRLIRPGWELDLPAHNGENPPVTTNLPQPENEPPPQAAPSVVPEHQPSTREAEHGRTPTRTQRPLIELPSGAVVATSFASGLLAAHALAGIRLRRSRRALAEPDEGDPQSLVLDLRRRATAPAAGHLEAAAMEIAGAWQRVHSSLPRFIAAIEERDRAIFLIAKPNSEHAATLPPSSMRIVFRDEGDSVRAEVRRPFPPKMVRAETPLETGLLAPIGTQGRDSAVHIGLLGLGQISVEGERSGEFVGQTLLSCAADTSADDLEIYLLGDLADVGPSTNLNHVRASAGWDATPKVLNRIQAELLARARAFMNEGVDDFWSFLATRVDERIRGIVVVASRPPAALTGVVEAIASQMNALGGAFIAVGWTPIANSLALRVDSKVVLDPPVLKLPASLRPLLLTPAEMEEAVRIVNEARPPSWDADLRAEESLETADSSSASEMELAEASEDLDRELTSTDNPDDAPGVAEPTLKVEDEPPLLLDDIPETPTEGQLEVRAFGNFSIVKDGRLIEKGMRTASKELLAYLVAQPQGAIRDRMIEDLRPEVDSEAAGLQLNKALYFLKRRTGSGRTDHISHVGDLYRLDFKYWWTDVAAFESILTAAGSLAAEDAIAQLSAALDLYRGPLFDDCYYSWAETPRNRYRSLFVKSSARLANLMMEYGESDDAISALDRAIDVDPVNEDLYRRAMAIEGRIGRSKAVVKRFNKLEAILQDELDVDPDEETSALLRQIMRESEERKRSLRS